MNYLLAQLLQFECTGRWFAGAGGDSDRLCTITDLFRFIRTFTNFLMVAVAPAALIIVIAIGAYKIIFSAGDPKRIVAGRETIFWAVVGFVVVIGAWAIINTILELLGITPPCPWYQLQC